MIAPLPTASFLLPVSLLLLLLLLWFGLLGGFIGGVARILLLVLGCGHLLDLLLHEV